MHLVLDILALLLGIGTLSPLIRCDVWVIRGWDFPRLQLLVLGLAVLFGRLFASWPGSWWEWMPVAVLGIAIIYAATSMRRYTPLYPREVKDGEDESAVKILVSNVLMSNRDSGKLLATVRENHPDLLVALETDSWWTEQISSLSDILPHAVEVPQDDTYGMVLRSRLPLLDPEVKYLIRDNIPSIHGHLQLKCGVKLAFHAVHPKPPFPDESTSSTERDAELLLVGKAVKESGGPTLVLGDLNDVAWSRSTRMFQKISGLLDPRIGRGCFSTYHAGHAWLRWPLDHVFISPEFRVRKIARLPHVGSDHFPIFADFSYEPDRRAGQDGPTEDAGDEEEADEKIAEAREA